MRSSDTVPSGVILFAASRLDIDPNPGFERFSTKARDLGAGFWQLEQNNRGGRVSGSRKNKWNSAQSVPVNPSWM
jgi:hypothetical protein